MRSFENAARILTAWAMRVLGRAVIELERFTIFFTVYAIYISSLLRSVARGETGGNLVDVERIYREVAPERMYSTYIRGRRVLTHTWADFARDLRRSLVTTLGAQFDNDATAFRIAMFAWYLWSELRVTVESVHARSRALATRFVDFMLEFTADAADRAEPEVDAADQAEPDVDAASRGRGSRSRRRGVSYEEELTRTSEATLRYSLRRTRVREERMARLRAEHEARMARLKAEQEKRTNEKSAGSSSKGSQRRSSR